jgi:hypothetical protein
LRVVTLDSDEKMTPNKRVKKEEEKSKQNQEEEKFRRHEN